MFLTVERAQLVSLPKPHIFRQIALTLVYARIQIFTVRIRTIAIRSRCCANASSQFLLRRDRNLRQCHFLCGCRRLK